MKIYVQHLQSTEDNIKEFVNNDTRNIRTDFNTPDFSCKIIPSKTLYEDSFNDYKHQLTKGAIAFLHHISHNRLIDTVTYDANNFAYDFVEDRFNEGQFEGAKLHWLVNDIKISGLGYPPQGYMQRKGFVCHPGTFRFLAAFAQQLNVDVSVWDTYNKFDNEALSCEDWLIFCSNGFIRNTRNITVKQDDVDDTNKELNHKFLEVHETRNHHDHNIFNQDIALAQMYNNIKPIIFCKNIKIQKQIEQHIHNPGFLKIKVIQNSWFIPHLMSFKGVGLWVGEEDLVHSDICHLFLYLDINDDIAYLKNKDIKIFNNSTHNCKKLIPEIINESTPEYLNEYKWASKTSRIPAVMGETL